MTSSALGAFIGIAISVSTASSFSIQSPCSHLNNHPVQQFGQNLQQDRHLHSRIGETSLGMGKWNHHPGRDGTKNRVDDTDRSDSSAIPSLESLNCDTNVFDLGDLNGDNDEKDGAFRFQRLDLDVQPTQGSSPARDWGGLNDCSSSSPSTFALGFGTYVPKGVSASVFSSGEDSSSPLVLTPNSENQSEAEFLRSFLRSNQNWVDERILEYGGIVFRGFGDPGGTAAVGKEIVRALGGGNGISSSSSSSPDLDAARKGFGIYLVSEHRPHRFYPSSVRDGIDRRGARTAWPKRVAEISTRTWLTDWRRIHDDLPPRLRRKLTEKDLLYTRTRRAGSSSSSSTEPTIVEDDIAMMTELDDAASTDDGEPSAWYRLFGSTNKRVFADAYRHLVEATEGATAPAVVRETFRSEAFRLHPHTSRKIWFELAHRFHWTSLPAELLAGFRRTKNPLLLLRALQEATVGAWKHLRRGNSRRSRSPSSSRGAPPPEATTTTVSFGDGTPLSWWEMHRIRLAIRNNTARHPWKPGDFLVVDGLSLGPQ